MNEKLKLMYIRFMYLSLRIYACIRIELYLFYFKS